MLTVSRRGLFALGGSGAAGAVLAACGESADPRETGDDAELAQAEVEAELALETAYRQAGSTAAEAEQRTAFEAFAGAAADRADQIASAAGVDVEPPPGPDGGPDGPEALSAAINLANSAIAAHRAAVTGLDSVESRELATSALATCAAELAAASGFAGEPEAPRAFVTGAEEEPYEGAEDTETTDETTTDETTPAETTPGAEE
jgi:hypothetical protein